MKCQNCGYEAANDDLFCLNCGKKLSPPDNYEEAKDIEKTEEAPAEVKTEEAKEEPAPEEKPAEEKSEEAKEEPAPEEKPAEEIKTGGVSLEKPAAEPAPEAVPESAAFAGEPAAAAIAADGAAVQPKKHTGVIIAIAAAGVVVIALLIVLAMSMTGPKGDFVFTSDKTPALFTNSADETLVFVGSKQIGKADGRFIISECPSYGSAVCFITQPDADLYYADASGMNRIASDVDNCRFSASGSAVMYISDGELYLYNISAKKSERIADEAESAAISPDGKTVAYSNGSGKCFIYSAGKTSEFDGRDIFPAAIADNAKYFYYIKNGNLYVNSKNEDVKLAGDPTMLLLNKDCSEALFCADDKVFVSINGGEKQKIASGISWAVIATPKNAEFSYPSINGSSSVYMYTVMCPFSSFNGKILYSSDSVRYITSKKGEWTAEKIASGIDRFMLAQNGKTAAYIKNRKIYFIKDLSKSLDGEELCNDVSDMAATADLSDIYYITDEDELRYIGRNGNSAKICDDVGEARVSDDGKVFFTVEDTSRTSVLYVSSDKKTKTKVEGGGETLDLFCSNGCVYFYAYNDGDTDLYACEKGTKFVCIIKDADMAVG